MNNNYSFKIYNFRGFSRYPWSLSKPYNKK